jgi:TetR/AcrR family fatty acid metabolism transcriptional regulator
VGKAPMTLARDRMREARRLALLEAAEQVFAERGFAGATMAEIAARAGYSAGNLYNVFEGKEALFEAAVKWRGRLLHARLEEALSGTSPIRDKIDSFVQEFISFVEERWATFAIYLQTTSSFSWDAARLDRDVLKLQSMLERKLTTALEGAIESGEIALEDPEVYACLLFGTMQRCVARWCSDGGTAEDLRQRAEPLSRMLARAMGASSGSGP